MSDPSAAASPVLGFGLIRSPVAPLQHEPRVSSMQVSQALFGRVVWHLEARGDWHRVRTAHDDYEGWMHAGYVELVADDALGALASMPDATTGTAFAGVDPSATRVSLGCTVLAGARRLRLPLGAWVHREQELLDGEAVPLGELAARFPRDGAALERTARRWFEGTRYEWGGVTPWGADCSGFVQSVLALHGIDLPRDAWQQALVGGEAAGVASDVATLAAGDLLYFSDREDRRITHVGLALGDARMAHLALGRGGWAVEELADVDDPYVARLRAQRVTTRRVL